MQTDAFREGEGDAWYLRNKDHLGQRLINWPLQVLRDQGIQADQVIDIGCADGRLLHQLWHEYAANLHRPFRGTGVDVSRLAIMGAQAWAKAKGLPFHFYVASVDELIDEESDESYSLACCIYTLHWVDRSFLLMSCAEIDRILKPGGYLLIDDFAPAKPLAVPYHHKPGLHTYHLDYAAIFLMTGCYRVVSMVEYDYNTSLLQDRETAERDRAACILLQKESQYQCE